MARVLIGFVQWDPANNGFFLATRGDNTQGIDRRVAGVRADRIEARDGVLLLQTSDSGTNGAAKLLIRLEEADPTLKPQPKPGFLIFGPDDGQGGITKVFTVDDKGNVTAQGKIASTDISGKVTIQSGVATDGVIIPPPPGITDDQVRASGIVLHTQVTPRVVNSGPPGLDGNWMRSPSSVRWTTSAGSPV